MKSVSGNTEAARLLTIGAVNGTQIKVDVTHLYHSVPVFVTLTSGHPYTLANPPGWVARTHMTGTGHATASATSTIAAGTRFACLKLEADALVAAGVAVYS